VPRLSIVVLPFANLSSNPEQQYFADAITEDVTTDLSRIAHSFVIKRVDTNQIGRDLGVRYVLEGSVRRSANKVRINTQLIDAETDAHLWAEQFDGDIGDLFELQNEITSRIAIALNLELTSREATRSTEQPDALDYLLRGRAAYWDWQGARSRDRLAETTRLFERAPALDPRSVEAKSWVAYMLWLREGDRSSESPTTDLQRADELVGQALEASPRDWFAHHVKGNLLLRTATNGVQSSLYVVFLKGNGLTGTSIGILFAAIEVMSGLGSLFAGRAMALGDPRRTMLSGTVLSIVLICVTPFLGGIFLLLFLAQAARGWLQGVVQPLMFSVQAKAVGRYRQGSVVGLRQTMNRLAAIVIPPAMGAIADRWGAGESFVILGSLLLMLSAPVALITRRTARQEAEPTLAG